uniref:Uncharacterized protein n=1 Tax=Arundo donax TaxID=35708 RepID=A0A0A9FQZ9_ARUDO
MPSRETLGPPLVSCCHHFSLEKLGTPIYLPPT